MKFKFREQPRKFIVGAKKDIELSDCGQIFLDSNEQVTFNDDLGNEYDVCKKNRFEVCTDGKFRLICKLASFILFN